MICEKCKIDKPDSCFINNKKTCYRCEYQEKLKKVPKTRDVQPLLCRMCKTEIIHKKELKKRQRTVFCSLICALEGQKALNNSYWTRNIINYKSY